MKTQNKPVFSTDSLVLAALLKTKACNLLYVSKDDPRHAIFHFEENPERERLTKDFWDGKALVEPRAFFSNQKELKTLIYDNSYIGESK